MASNPQTDAEERAGPSVHRARFASGAAGPSVEENPPPEQECRGVRVSLENHRMWREFLLCQTEMVASPEGSRMFPYCRFTLAGLQPSRKYSLQLELGLSRQHRFSWTGTHWETAGPASTQAKVRGRPFTHPDSPAPGRHWMESPVSFYRLKLTDGATPQEGALALTLRHRYQPTLLLLPEGGDAPTASFSFPQTEFMAVSSYHNKELTQLKIHYNPFSKGHAHTDRHTHADHHTHNDRQTRTNNDSEGTAAGVHPVKSLKSLLSRHKARRSESEKAPPTQSSSAPLKLFSELIREAHVSLHRCNVNDLNLSQTSKPPKEQEVVPTDRTPKEPPPSKVGGSPEGQQPKRPARLPLPALALFLKQHSSKTSKRKQQPVPPAETGPPRVCSPSLDSQHTVPPPAPPGPGTVSVAECRRTSPSRPSSNPCGTRWASGVPNASSVHLSDPPPPSPPAAPPPPVSKSAEGAGLLPDPECSSLEFEALSPASSPEPLPSLPSSLTFDLEDPGGPQGATSVFQWHTVLPPLDQIPDHALPAFPPAPPSPQRPSYTDPQEPPSLPFPAELSPLVLSLSPSFSSLDGDGLSPSSSLADLVTLFSNTDDFSTADLTNDHSADPFSTGSHGNNDDTDGGVDDDFSTINNQRVDDEDLNPSSISRVVHHPTTDLSIHDFTSNTCSEDVAGPPHPEPGPEGVPAYPSDDDISIQETSAAGDALVTDAPTKDESRPTSPMEETPMEETPMEETPYGTLQASLEEVEEQLFVSFTTKEALKLHSCDSSEEAEPQRAEGPHEDGVTERLSVSEDLRRSIETFQDLLLEDLRVMKHRQVIHPVLQEVGLKMNLLDAQFAVNLQYLGVLLPLPPPGPGPGPGQQNQALSPSAAFVSRTGKASAVTQIKGWRERFSPAEAPPPAENCSVQVPAEPQKKRNLSAFCSDMLDQYLETEGKLIGQQVSSFPQPADDAQLYSCSFLPAPGPASQLISAPTPGPATQLISAFVPPSKRLRVPEGKRRGRKPRKPKADPIPQPPGRRRRRKAPPLADPPTNELAPLESDSELGPSSETEGRRDDPTPLETPPLAVATFNYLAPLESDSELPLPPTEADSKMAPPLLEAPPTRRRVVLKQRDLEEAAVWDGHARTAVTDDRASIALTSLFTLKGFVVDDPLAPVQMASRHPPRCLNDFCRLGCVCESLGAVRRPAHCAQASCMFSCSCLKQKVVLLKNLEPPSQLDHSGRKRKKRRKRRMKMAYILKEADCVSAPSPLLRTLWTNQREADPEPLHVPQVLVPSSSQKVRTVTSSCARVRTFPRKKGATEHTAEKATGIEKPGKSIGSAGTPSGSAPKQMMSRRLLVTSDCKWKTEGERSDVLQQLCEALTSQPPQTTFWIKDCLVQVSPPSSKGDTQYKAHISRSKGPGTPGEGRPGPGRPGPGRPGLGRPGPGRPGPGRPRKSQSSVRPEEASDPRGEEPGERRRLMMKRSALPFLTGVSPAGFLSANRREVGGTKQLVEVNGKFYPLAKIQLGMMGALHPANRLAALLTGRLGSRCSSPSPQHTPPTDTVDLDDNDIMSGEDETVASTETGLSVENTTDSVTDAEEDELNPDPQRHIHNFLEKQRRLQIRDQLHFLRKEIGLVNSKSSEILVLNKAVQLIGQLQEEEVELKQRKSILKRRRDQKLSLISSKEGEELKQVSSEVTADTKEEHNKLSAGGGASDHRVPSHDQLIISQVLPPPVSAPTPPVSAPTPPVSAPPFPVSAPPLLVSAPPPPVSAPPTCSPVQVFLKPPRTTPNILLHNKRPKNTHGEITTNSDGEPSQESSKVSPPEPNVSHLMGKKLVLQSATNSATNIIKVQYSQKQQTPQQQKQTNMNLIKFYISPQTQPLIIKPQTQEIQKQIIQQTLTKQTQPATNTKVIKVHFEPTGQQTQQQGQNTQDTQLQQHIVGLADQQYKQPLQTHQLLLQTQPLQLIGPAVACDPPPATNGWKDATENLQTLLNQLVFFKQATPTVQALPTEVSVGGANQRTEGVELNKLCHTHLDAKALPPLMQMKVDGTKLLDTPMTDTAESGIGGGVEGEVWRPMPRLLKGNPPT